MTEATVTPTITSVTLGQVETAQAIIGEGVPVVLLHGWGANISLVWPLAEKLAPLGYRVYALDLPGFGQSANPSVAWAVADYVDHVLAYLDYHQLEKVYLFGHSFGGRLGLVLGAEHAQRIDKLVLADSAGVKSAISLSIRVRLSVYKTLRDGLYKVGMKSLADDLHQWYAKRYGSADYRNVVGVMRQTFVQVVNQDLLPYAAQVQVPTLLFWGDRDEDTPLWQGELLEKTIPDAGLVVHKGAGHYSYLDHLSDTVRVMDYFFQQE